MRKILCILALSVLTSSITNGCANQMPVRRSVPCCNDQMIDVTGCLATRNKQDQCNDLNDTRQCPGCGSELWEGGCDSEAVPVTHEKLHASVDYLGRGRFAEGCDKGFNSWLDAKLSKKDKTLAARLAAGKTNSGAVGGF
jgi:hypothetical protein